MWDAYLNLENFCSHHRRHQILRWLARLLLLCFAAILLAALARFVPALIKYKALAYQWTNPLVGATIIILDIYIFIALLEAWFRSAYYDKQTPAVAFEAALIINHEKDGDALSALLVSDFGHELLARLGLSETAVAEFLKARQALIPKYPTPVPGAATVTPVDLGQYAYKEDAAFRQWLLEHGIVEADWQGALGWVWGGREEAKTKEQWWSSDNLNRRPGIGRDWGYGGTYTLDRYSQEVTMAAGFHYRSAGVAGREGDTEKLMAVLARSREANAILVAPAGSAKLEIVRQLAGAIARDTVLSPLKHKRVILFNVSGFLSGFKDQSSLESGLLKLLAEVVKAGNVIWVIDDLPLLVTGANSLGGNAPALLDPYLAGSALQIIALADTTAFNQQLEALPALLNRFEKITLNDIDPADCVDALRDVVERLENNSGLYFTFPSLLALVQSADRYFAYEGALVDKANDLAVEIIPWAVAAGKTLIGKAEVLAFVQGKTNIPLGEISGAERDTLTSLETVLHQRVIGQDEAINGVASAMRRARAGVRNSKRPIGSFMFLGPTGVGKTETAKALAAVFFGSEDKMIRLDMSEYSAPDALNRLIGSFTTKQAGILASALRENPYSVLLLDEFEKTNPDVLNLFLQILDEGFFSDMQGERVNVRNTIIVATSNAGSTLIFDMIKNGRNPTTAKDELIKAIVDQGTFKPELLNRFDAAVIFTPLDAAQTAAIAKLMLNKLAKRLIEQGLTLVVTDPLVAEVVAKGTNQLFGARPMNRYIQDNVEQPIADGLIRGTIKSGSKVEFVQATNGGLSLSVH